MSQFLDNLYIKAQPGTTDLVLDAYRPTGDPALSLDYLGDVLVNNLAGTGFRLVQVNDLGVLQSKDTIVAYGVPNTEKLKLENASNWSINGEYTGPTITGTYQGQKHYDDNYFYEAVSDNIFIRLIRG